MVDKAEGVSTGLISQRPDPLEIEGHCVEM